MWEQTLSGLIKALRAKKDQEKLVIQQALSEISKEVKTTDLDLKAGAILKLTYLDMLGYPQLSTYSFNVIECMSSPKFHIKQIGYLAACQSFGPKTEVSMLTTNLVKKVRHPFSFFDLAYRSSSTPFKTKPNQKAQKSSLLFRKSSRTWSHTSLLRERSSTSQIQIQICLRPFHSLFHPYHTFSHLKTQLILHRNYSQC